MGLRFVDSFDHYPLGYAGAIDAPNTPTLGSVSGGTLAGATYFVEITYVTIAGETNASGQASLAVAANNLLVVTSPGQDSPHGYAIGYNVYVSTTSGDEVLQNSTPIAIGTNWTEPTSGIILTNPGVPVSNTATHGGLIQKWTDFFIGIQSSINILNNGRRSAANPIGHCLQIGASGVAPVSLEKTLGAATLWYIGFAVNFAQISNANWSIDLRNLNGYTEFYVQLNGDGTFGVFRGNHAGTNIANTSKSVTANKWYYFEMAVNMQSTATGSVTLTVGGVNWLTLTNVQTKVDTLDITNFQFNMSGGNSSRIDDLYVDSSQNIGDVTIIPIWPNGVGTHQDWTAVGATPQWEAYGVTHDKTGADEDTTYIESATVGDIETDNFEDIGPASKIWGAQWVFQLRKTDAGTRLVQPMIRQAGVDYLNTTQKSVTDDYLYHLQIYDTDPTGADWTSTTVNSDEFGLKLVV